MLGASATTPIPTEPPARPLTIQGRRMPSRDVVRSLIRPKNGLATMASRAPTAATSARLAGARSLPTSESTFKAKVTSRGARNSRLVLIYASVYSAMKPHPTWRAEGESGSGAASAAARSADPRRAVPGQAAASANRITRDGLTALKGMVILSCASVTRTPHIACVVGSRSANGAVPFAVSAATKKCAPRPENRTRRTKNGAR